MDNGWATLTVAHGLGPADQADLIALEAQLQAAGIDVRFDPARPGDQFNLPGIIRRDFTVLVPAGELSRAREFLADFYQQPDRRRDIDAPDDADSEDDPYPDGWAAHVGSRAAPIFIVIVAAGLLIATIQASVEWLLS